MQPGEMPPQLPETPAWTLLLCLCIFVWILLTAAEQDVPTFLSLDQPIWSIIFNQIPLLFPVHTQKSGIATHSRLYRLATGGVYCL